MIGRILCRLGLHRWSPFTIGGWKSCTRDWCGAIRVARVDE